MRSLEQLPLIGFLFTKKPISERPLLCFLCGMPFFLFAYAIAMSALRLGGGLGTASGLLIAVGPLLCGAIFWTLPIANWIGTLAGNFYTGGEQFSTPPPSYSAAEGLVASGYYEEAIEAYEKIAADHPYEITPHLQVMKIWITKLQNPQAAADAYMNAMNRIKGARNRERFDRMARNDYSKHIQFG